MRYIYIIQCADATLYTGITTDLQRRILEHNTSSKGANYTKNKRPVTLIRSEQTTSRSLASQREYQIKHLTRDQKISLIAENKKPLQT